MPLTVFKASAGSGKTFRLTLSFLELIFKEPQSYRHILAVTFTNKAASEMKSRILERLYHMSLLKEGESSDDAELLAKACGLSIQEIVKKAGDLLVRILNDYSRFSVGTIDKFFQGVIRAFTREIGLPAGFGLELDKDRVLGEAVDRMLMNVGDDKDLLKWVLRFAESKVESAKSWNFRQDMIKLGKELFSEAYHELLSEKDETINRVQLEAFMKRLLVLRKEEEANVKDLANLTLTKMGEYGYDESSFLRGAGGPASYFRKATEGRLHPTPAQIVAMTETAKWISKNETDPSKTVFVETVLQPNMKEMHTHLIMLNTVVEAGHYIYALGILGDLSTHILDITDERNIFLLSDASRFLKGLISDNPTPFVYEKTGSYLEHIMLDEFQDTSVFQWENFRPLLEHTLSSDMENVVVGDVKQSIYRWRNSDWKILAEELVNTFGKSEIREEALTSNWRSKEKVIEFNNSLFSSAPQIVKDLISTSMDGAAVSDAFKAYWEQLLDIAYSDVQQKVPEKSKDSGGYVRGEVLSSEEQTFNDLTLDRVPEWIRELEDAGYAPGDIAILVRTNNEAAEVARKLMEVQLSEDTSTRYNFNFVSNESLFLNNNPAIRFVVCMLTYLHSPSDDLNILYLKYFHASLCGDENKNAHELLTKEKDVKDILGDAFVEMQPKLKRLPLFEMAEQLIDLFQLDDHKRDLPYLQAFQEIIVEIQRNDPGSLHDFLSYWNEFGAKKSIVVSDQQDAIRIITIHKAKGLEYKAVLVPFCNWKLLKSGGGDFETILWQDTKGTIFDELPILPLRFSKNLAETHFASRYLEELIMGYVDNLNLLYVAFTRAEEVLIMGLAEANAKGDISNASHLVMQAVQINLKEHTNDTGFEIGTLATKDGSGETFRNNWEIDSYPVNLRSDSLHLRLKNNEFFLKETEGKETQMDFGNIMHEIFSLIETEEDVKKAVQRYVREGLLKQSDADELMKEIYEKLSKVEVKPWFGKEMQVFNEREIFADGKSYRPDRVVSNGDETVVVDYKFGERSDAKYLKQIGKYTDLLREMGFGPVRGYIWYVMLDEIIEL